MTLIFLSACGAAIVNTTPEIDALLCGDIDPMLFDNKKPEASDDDILSQ